MPKKWIWRGEEVDPPNHITKEEVQEMIDEAVDRAINQHNRNASIISAILGICFLALFSEGFFRVIGMIPPFMGIDVNMMQDVIDKVRDEVIKTLS